MATEPVYTTRERVKAATSSTSFVDALVVSGILLLLVRLEPLLEASAVSPHLALKSQFMCRHRILEPTSRKGGTPCSIAAVGQTR